MFTQDFTMEGVYVTWPGQEGLGDGSPPVGAGVQSSGRGVGDQKLK